MIGPDAFFATFPLWSVPCKVARYQQRVLAAGQCVRCRQPRGRAGRYCARCVQVHNARSQQARAKERT